MLTKAKYEPIKIPIRRNDIFEERLIDNFKLELYELPEERQVSIWQIIHLLWGASPKILKIIYYVLLIASTKMTKQKLTSLVGAVIGLIAVILNIGFGITIPEDVSLTIIGLIVTLVMFVWKPKEDDK